MKGRLIAVDTIDGGGKGLQIRRLVEGLRVAYPGVEILETREPWDVPDNDIGLRIRKVIGEGGRRQVWPEEEGLNHQSLQYLYFLDRCVHYMKCIIPALEQGKLVITDRERMVTFAYGMAAGVDSKVIKGWHDGMMSPDLFIYLRVDAEVANKRIESRSKKTGQAKELFEDPERVRKNVEGFDGVAALGVIDNLKVVDGNPGPDEVAAAMMAAVEDKLGDWLRERRTA